MMFPQWLLSPLFCALSLLFFAPLLRGGDEEGAEQQVKTGFHLSDSALLNIHFSLASEYDTNINQVSEKSSFADNRNPARNYTYTDTMDLILRLSPGLRAKIDDKSKTLAMGLLVTYNLYTGIEDKRTFDNYSNLSSLHFDTNLLGEFNKDGNVIVQASNNLKRHSRPDQISIENGLHTNLFEDFLLSLYIKNTEDTLGLKIASGIQTNYFEEPAFSKHNFWNSRNTLYGQWKFFPKTAVFFNASFIYQDYYNAGDYRDAQRSMPLSVFAGALGQVTPKISLRLSGGYTNSFSHDMHHDGVAGLEFVFKQSQNTLLRLGYIRSLMPVPVFQYYVLDKVYANVTQKFFNRLLLKFDANYSHYAYGKNVRYPTLDNRNNPETVTNPATGTTKTLTTTQKSIDREDHVVKIEPAVSYNFLPWLGLSLQYTFETRQTPYWSAQRVATTGGTISSDVTYTTHYDYFDHRILFVLTADY